MGKTYRGKEMGGCLSLARQINHITLGDYPTISLQQARLTALEIQQKVKQGSNPKTTKPAQSPFGELANEYHNNRNLNNPTNKDKHTVVPTTYKRGFAQYQNDIAPYLAHIDLNAVTPQMILGITKRVYGMTIRVIRQIGKIFTLAKDKGLYDRTPPTDGIEKCLTKRKSEPLPA